jgi:hypothetical protein
MNKNGSRHPPAPQMGLQLHTAHGRHSDIRDDAPDIVEFRRLKKSLCRVECADDVSQRSDKIVQAGTNGCIVIDN